MSRVAADRDRYGFTLLEIVVVVCILAIAISLALAGVSAVRSAAARATCSDRLRQLALASHNFHGEFGRFPPGTGSGRSADDPYAFQCWTARLLPFLGETSLWAEIQRAYSANPDFRNNPPHILKSRALPYFACPSDPRTAGPATLMTPINGFTSYLGVMGPSYRELTGVLFFGSRVSIGEITDGASHTLFAGERPPSADERLGWWYAGWGQQKDGSGDAVLGVQGFNQPIEPRDRECPFGPYRFTYGRIDDQCDAFHFWSLHPGGAHFAFADGSVRFLSYSADSVIVELSTRNGGEAISTDW